MKPIKTAQCLTILLIIQNVNCMKSEESRSKKLETANNLVRAVYVNLAEQYAAIDKFEATALEIQIETAKHGQAMAAVMSEYNRAAIEEIIELRAVANGLDVDTEKCFQDFSNFRFFIRDSYNSSVVTMKTEMWTDFGKYYQSFNAALNELKERVQEADRDKSACDDDDKVCFDEAFMEVQEVHELAVSALAEIKSKNIVYQVMKNKFFEKWQSQMQVTLDMTFRDEDKSALAVFRDCVRNQTMEWTKNERFSSASTSSTKRVDL